MESPFNLGFVPNFLKADINASCSSLDKSMSSYGVLSMVIMACTTSHGTMNYTPRISTFFGELGKGEAPYDLWK
jgi:hypothetical protein